MRKLFFLLSIFTLVLSCSKDETPPPAPIVKYTITLSAGEGGTVSTTGGEYEAGQTVSVTATPQGEYLFKDWSDGNTNATRTITVNSNTTLTANFEKRKYPLTINFVGEGEVIEEIVNAGRSTDYDSGTTVKLTAQAAAEWVFVGWTGDIESTEESVQIVIGEPKEVTAKFEKKKYPLTVNIEGEGEVLEEIVNAGRTTDYNSGTTVKLTAVPAEGWEFVGWTGAIESEELEVQIIVSEAKEVNVVFIDLSLISETSLRVSLNESLESVKSQIKPQIQELLDELNQAKENYQSKNINQQVFISSMSQIEVKLDDIYFENNIMEDGLYYQSYSYVPIESINIFSAFEEISDNNYSSEIYMGLNLPFLKTCNNSLLNSWIEVKNGIPFKYGFVHAGGVKFNNMPESINLYTGCGIHWIPYNTYGIAQSYAKGKGIIYNIPDNRLIEGDISDYYSSVFLFKLNKDFIPPRIEDVQEEDEFWGDEIYKDIDWNDPISYVMAFLKDAERHGVDLSFVDTESIIAEVVDELPNVTNPNVAAASYLSGDKTKVNIKYKKSAWDRHTYFNSNNMRILTIWHELGHDILQLAHNDEEDNKIWYDIMKSGFVVIDGGDYRGFKYFQKGVERLFSGEGQIKLNYASKGERVIACDFEIKD